MLAPNSFTTRPSHSRSRKSFDHSPMLVFYELTQACDLRNLALSEYRALLQSALTG